MIRSTSIDLPAMRVCSCKSRRRRSRPTLRHARSLLQALISVEKRIATRDFWQTCRRKTLSSIWPEKERDRVWTECDVARPTAYGVWPFVIHLAGWSYFVLLMILDPGQKKTMVPLCGLVFVRMKIACRPLPFPNGLPAVSVFDCDFARSKM